MSAGGSTNASRTQHTFSSNESIEHIFKIFKSSTNVGNFIEHSKLVVSDYEFPVGVEALLVTEINCAKHKRRSARQLTGAASLEPEAS